MGYLQILIFQFIFLIKIMNCTYFFPSDKVINTCGYLETKQPRNSEDCKEEGEICCFVDVTDPNNNFQNLKFCVSSPSHLTKEDIKEDVKVYTGYILNNVVCNKSKFFDSNSMKILIFFISIIL